MTVRPFGGLLLALAMATPACTQASGDTTTAGAAPASAIAPSNFHVGVAPPRPLAIPPVALRAQTATADTTAGTTAMSAPTMIDETGYTLTASAPASVKPGASATAELQLTPKAGYHVNLDAPLQVTVAPPAGVKLAKTDYSKTDATKIAKDGARFAIPMSVTSPGAVEVPATVKFVVCDDAGTTCLPSRKTVAWHLEAK